MFEQQHGFEFQRKETLKRQLKFILNAKINSVVSSGCRMDRCTMFGLESIHCSIRCQELGEEYLFKVVLIGDSAVGKSHLLSQLATNEFNQNSKAIFGVNFQTPVVEIYGKEIKAQIWGTAGQQNSLSLPSACKAFELTKTPIKFIATFDIEGHDP
ncbi:hypothetical protein M0R45_032561 [Rubus argutus]|uniref:Uncharacterized protein n=1 Tax=Rubus argutus TaxID=59490 RepID=A0AAW1WKM3_RUBAR